MTTRYIDVNCGLSQRKNETNNRWTYVLPDGLEIPTGSQISVQNSLINLKGITGQSIEIEEQIDETILFNYYMCDTSYEVPVLDIGDPTTVDDYNLFCPMGVRMNAQQQKQGATLPDIDNNNYGFTENILPLVMPSTIKNSEGAGQGDPDASATYLVPLCGRADIRIPPGIYTVSSLGELITDQINRVKLRVNPNKDCYEDKRERGTNRGLTTNRTTTRFIKTELFNMPIEYQNNDRAGNPVPDSEWAGIPADKRRPLTAFDNEIVSAIAITPKHMSDVFFQAKSNVYDSTNTTDNVKISCFRATSTTPEYGVAFQRNNGESIADAQNYLPYNLFSVGTGVGTTGFKLSYDSEESAFSFNHLHEPRRIPTHDKRGNSLSNPSQECVYVKRIPQYDNPQLQATDAGMKFWDGYTREQHTIVANCLNAYVMRYSGVAVYNWAYQTCQNEGNNDTIGLITTENDNNPDRNQFWNFDDFFKTEKEARTAWKTTVWSRLGFGFDTLVNKDNYENQNFFGDIQQINGTTTRADIDQSSAPFISTIYNNYGKAAQTETHNNQVFALPGVADVQLFNLTDCNVPQQPYNNNKNAPGDSAPNAKKLGLTAPFEGSFYDWAGMIPVQTTGRELKADTLPTLSKSGYMLVLTDLVEQNDFAGNKSELGMIDMIPKSSLSNQDFISDRNFISHTLSNPKTINSISVAVVNPDLTDISLEENSTILMKIVSPIQKPTVLLADADVSFAESEIQEEEEKNIQAQLKQEKK